MATLHGKSLIAGIRSTSETGETFRAISALDLTELPGNFQSASTGDLNSAMEAARLAFPAFKASPADTRARFLEAIAENLVAATSTLIDRAHLETGLPHDRLQTEIDRTTNHLRMFAEVARSGSWLNPQVEPGDPDRIPLPKPDLRKINQPIGPVVVFGASNFPFAYSVAGGDTVSALATGNPVVVKAHEAHPGTSELVAEAILAAIAKTGLPPGIFSLLQGTGQLLGIPLVSHPATRAVGFTGSTHAGRILIDAAARRPDPIPVFAEMGSLNPVVILPSASDDDPAAIAKLLVPAITIDAGQFCTKPGVIFIPSGGKSTALLDHLADQLQAAIPVPMLHRGIHASFQKGLRSLTSHPGVNVLAASPVDKRLFASPHLFLTDAPTFLGDENLRHEFFGPLAILVTYDQPEEIEPLLRSLSGQITASLFCEPSDPIAASLLPFLAEIAGRVILNGVPTGVEVNAASNHTGPWPACSDSRFTAVGPDALLRFIRPVTYQNTPNSLLPAALRRVGATKL